MKTKNLNREAMIKNINGLSYGDRAYCGPYGTITCYRAATSKPHPCKASFIRGTRRFKVANSTKIQNRGNWTMKALREAIYA